MKITAYTAIGFKESQNFLIESINDYLENLGTGVSWNDAQKITPNIDISFRLSAIGTMSYDKFTPFEYIKIEEINPSGSFRNVYYYFVRHISRRAENTILIDAHLDVLNTFPSLVTTGLTAKTMVIREHKDRFYKVDMSNYPRHALLQYKIDEISEGLSPSLFQTSKETVKNELSVFDDVSFYLIYKAQNDLSTPGAANPIDVYLCSDTLMNDTFGNAVLPFSSLDRTDSKLVKIIKLPYCPGDLQLSGNEGGYSFGSGWTFDKVTSLMKYGLLFTHSDFINKKLKPVVYANRTWFTADSINDAVYRIYDHSYALDPKLLHSDFHLEKFSYDSFSLSFPLEKTIQNTSGATNAQTNISFHPTNTVNSNLLFHFTSDDFENYLSDDYGDYLVSSRNSEETIFNNAYLDYLRTGYNYDKKTKALSNTARWTGAAASIVGGALSAGVGAATGHPVLAATGVTMVAGGVAQLTSAITSQISSENTFQSKIASLQAQSTSVSGCDDIDLLSDYGQNKLLHFTYDVSKPTHDMLCDLFFYYGYKQNIMEKPDVDSRYWFNFIQCNPVFANTGVILGVYEDELTKKLNDGITIFHEEILDSHETWDLKQQYLNWEKWIVD